MNVTTNWVWSWRYRFGGGPLRSRLFYAATASRPDRRCSRLAGMDAALHLPATYYVKVENTYCPDAVTSASVAQAAFRLARPARP